MYLFLSEASLKKANISNRQVSSLSAETTYYRNSIVTPPVLLKNWMDYLSFFTKLQKNGFIWSQHLRKTGKLTTMIVFTNIMIGTVHRTFNSFKLRRRVCCLFEKHAFFLSYYKDVLCQPKQMWTICKIIVCKIDVKHPMSLHLLK